MSKTALNLPWRSEGREILDANGHHVCSNSHGGNIRAFIEQGDAYMRFIARACNAHDDLLTACENLATVASDACSTHSASAGMVAVKKACIAARAAIAKAKP